MHNREFIFSALPVWRIQRHLTFWLCAWLFAACAYPPFNYAQMSGLIDGGAKKYYQMVILRVTVQVACQMFFVYPLMYLLIPVFFRKRKYLAFILMIFPLWAVTGAFRLYTYEHVYSPAVMYLHLYASPPKMKYIYSLRQTLTGPAFSGFIFIFMKMLKDWQIKQRENAELMKESYQAQVQLLQAQIHPHFLFNTLNNIYSFTLNRSPVAGTMVRQLSAMLGYMAGDGSGSLVTLEREVKLISDYINLERFRYGESLQLQMDITGPYNDKLVSPLLLIPFVENSFKHGASKLLAGPWILLRLWIVDNRLFFNISNNKPPGRSGQNANGIGISNVKKRLHLLYDQDHKLQLENLAETFTVNLEIPLQTMI